MKVKIPDDMPKVGVLSDEFPYFSKGKAYEIKALRNYPSEYATADIISDNGLKRTISLGQCAHLAGYRWQIILDKDEIVKEAVKPE